MTVQTLADYVPGDQGIVRRWLDELDIAGEWQKTWEQQARNIIDRYEGCLSPGMTTSFNVLHSNVETLRPAMFGQPPSPDVRRRADLPEQNERTAAGIIEKALRYMMDTQDYCGEVDRCITDVLLTGRGVMRVRYIPTIVRRQERLVAMGGETDSDERYVTANMNEVGPDDVIIDDEGIPWAQIEKLQFERADVEHVPYNNFRHTPARRWQDVRWTAYRHLFTKDELEQAFGKAVADGTSTTVQATTRSATRDDHVQPDNFEKAEVWEIWDKVERQILFVSEGNPNKPLATIEADEYYELHDFFCTVEPLRSIRSPKSLLPVPEFVIYQDLADELDIITSRITAIVSTIDVRGAYDGALPELADIFDGNRRLIPVNDWRALTDKGGLSGVIDFVNIEPQVKAFVALTQQRNLLLDTIYQTIGLSDISRGSSDPRESATAQRLKGQVGQLRMTPRQRGVQYYLRDLMRLQAEIICEKFEPVTLQLMTGEEITPEVLQLLRIDALRTFAIDIETDSTIAADQAAQQAAIGEVLQGLSAFATASQGLPEGARLPLLRSIVRKFRLGRDVEIAIEEAAAQPPKPDPEMMKAQAEMQIKGAELQQKSAESQGKLQIEAGKLALKAKELGMKQDEAESATLIEIGKLFGGQRGAA